MNTKEDQLRWFTSFFNEKSSGNGVGAKTNYQLANEPHTQIIKKFKRRRVYSPLRNGLCGLDLADMQSLNKYNKIIKYLLCAINLFSKYAQVVSLKEERGITVVNAFQKVISKGHQPNKIWIDEGGEFYNNLFKRCLKINSIEMYSKYNEGKSVVSWKIM